MRVPAPAMPARRVRGDRMQLNARVRQDIGQLLHRFVDDHQTTVQGSVDLALVEFLAARGYSLPGAAIRDTRTGRSDSDG